MSLIWTPGGSANTERQVVQLNAGVLSKMAILAEIAGDLRWGMHCADCGQDITGKNAREDTHWRMECGCRSYVGTNPLPRA